MTFSKSANLPLLIAFLKRLESGQVHQANPVLKNALGVGAGLVGIKLLVAIRGVRRNRDYRFPYRGRGADGERLFYPRIVNPPVGR